MRFEAGCAGEVLADVWIVHRLKYADSVRGSRKFGVRAESSVVCVRQAAAVARGIGQISKCTMSDQLEPPDDRQPANIKS